MTEPIPPVITKLQLAGLIQRSKKPVVVLTRAGNSFDAHMAWLSKLSDKIVFQVEEKPHEIVVRW